MFKPSDRPCVVRGRVPFPRGSTAITARTADPEVGRYAMGLMETAQDDLF